MLHYAALILETESRELVSSLECRKLPGNLSISVLALASLHVVEPTSSKNRREEMFHPCHFSLWVGTATCRLTLAVMGLQLNKGLEP